MAFAGFVQSTEQILYPSQNQPLKFGNFVLWDSEMQLRKRQYTRGAKVM